MKMKGFLTAPRLILQHFKPACQMLRRIAMVTGAASGLGRATALRFARAGARVALLDLPGDGLEQVAEEIGKNAIMVPADVTDETAVQDAVNKTVSEFGGINALIQCAGIAPPAKVIGKRGPHSLEKFSKVLQVNTVGTFNVLRLAAEAMSKADPAFVAAEDASLVEQAEVDGGLPQGERGCIINTASVAAFEGQVGQCAYSASKGAVAAMTLPASRELAAHGIRVNCVAPGVFMTPMMEGLPPKVQQELGAIVPFPKRLGTGDEYARLAQSIVENPYLNGEVIRLDGGLRMSA